MSNSIYVYRLSHEASIANTGTLYINNAALVAAGCQAISGIACDASGNVYVSDAQSHAIFKCSTNGSAYLYAGLPGTSGNNGASRVTLENARFNSPSGIFCDKAGNVYLADSGNNQIRLISGSGFVTLVAGSPDGTAGFAGGEVLSALFRYPKDVVIDSSGRLYVADTMNHAIRMLHTGRVYTVAGNGTAGNVNGPALSSRLNKPFAIMPRSDGKLYIADSGNYQVKVYDSVNVWRFSGAGTYGTTIDGPTVSQFQDMRYGDIDRSGSIFLIDFDIVGGTNSRLMKINNNGSPRVVVHFDSAKDDIVKGLAIDPSQNMYVGLSSFIESVFDEGDTLTIDIESGENTYSLKYFGGTDTNGTVTLIGSGGTASFDVGDVAGDFVWDIGGAGEHTFTTPGESHQVTAVGEEINIVWEGVGCHKFKIEVDVDEQSSSSTSSEDYSMSSVSDESSSSQGYSESSVSSEGYSMSSASSEDYSESSTSSEEYSESSGSSSESSSSGIFPKATGGTITYDGTDVIHTFTSDGTFNVLFGSLSCDVLVIGGGGSGGGATGGAAAGGGGGGVVYATGKTVTGSIGVTVGDGGTGPFGRSVGNNGSNSVFDDIIAVGGGGGGGNDPSSNGSNGGSGGGGGWNTGSGGTGTQGNSGGGTGYGNNGASASGGPGGGGGAGAAGTPSNFAQNTNGAIGIQLDISGSSVYYAGGGGGAGQLASSGGGGDGAWPSDSGPGDDAQANTGGGGGAAWAGGGGGKGGNGGSGIVIVRYSGLPNESSSSSSSGNWVVVDDGDSVVIPDTGHTNVVYEGAAGTTATITVNGVSYTVANENIPPERFVWDSDNAQGGRHVFTFIGESIQRNAAGSVFSIVYSGTGSFIMTLNFDEQSSSSSSSTGGYYYRGGFVGYDPVFEPLDLG